MTFAFYFVNLLKIMVNKNLSTKCFILQALRKSSTPVSGESIAQECGLSRTAVWKAVQALVSSGYGIESVANGYVLQKDLADSICPWEFGAKENLFCYYGTTDSTMVQARKVVQEIQSGEKLKIVIADKQTKGVGQKGRSWKTTKGSLAFTMVTKSDLPILYSRRTVMACQIALVNVLRKNSGRNFFVRWPNDVWSEEGKVCGVLDELYSSGGICSWQNLGVGINVSSRPSIQNTDSVFKKAEPGIRRKIIGDFITEFELVKKEIASDTEIIAPHWNSLCMDRKKEFYAKDCGIKMKFIGIDSYGSAIVEKDSVCRTIPFGTFSFEKN